MGKVQQRAGVKLERKIVCIITNSADPDEMPHFIWVYSLPKHQYPE